MNRFKNLLLISLFAIGANAQSIDKVEAIIIESVTNGLTGKERIGHKYKED